MMSRQVNNRLHPTEVQHHCAYRYIRVQCSRIKHPKSLALAWSMVKAVESNKTGHNHIAATSISSMRGHILTTNPSEPLESSPQGPNHRLDARQPMPCRPPRAHPHPP